MILDFRASAASSKHEGMDRRAGKPPNVPVLTCPVKDPSVLAVVATPVGMRVLVARFFNHMISEDVQVFWAALQRGEFITDGAEAAGTYRKQGTRWVVANGGSARVADAACRAGI